MRDDARDRSEKREMAKKKPAPKKKAKKPKAVPPIVPGIAPGGDPTAPLAEDEMRFVQEYLVDRRRVMAYMRANPTVTRFLTASRYADDLISRPHVRAEIHSAIQSQARQTQVNANTAIKEIGRIAYSDPYDLTDPVTRMFRHPADIPIELRRAIMSAKVLRQTRTVTVRGRTRTTTVETVLSYTLWPKMDALRQVCRILGLEEEKAPLDALLLALPPALAASVRAAIATQIQKPMQLASSAQPVTVENPLTEVDP